MTVGGLDTRVFGIAPIWFRCHLSVLLPLPYGTGNVGNRGNACTTCLKMEEKAVTHVTHVTPAYLRVRARIRSRCYVSGPSRMPAVIT